MFATLFQIYLYLQRCFKIGYMKNIAIILFFVFPVQMLMAEHVPVSGSVSGVIKDAKTGSPLQSVSIYIADLKAGTNTNSRGEFIITNISQGIHLVEISHIGYTSIAENILVEGNVKKDFLLSESIIENNAVIVTGVTKATQLKKSLFRFRYCVRKT